MKFFNFSILLLTLDVEIIQECEFDTDGSVLSTSGDCYGSCDNEFYIELIRDPNGIFCCCKNPKHSPIELGNMITTTTVEAEAEETPPETETEEIETTTIPETETEEVTTPETEETPETEDIAEMTTPDIDLETITNAVTPEAEEFTLMTITDAETEDNESMTTPETTTEEFTSSSEIEETTTTIPETKTVEIKIITPKIRGIFKTLKPSQSKSSAIDPSIRPSETMMVDLPLSLPVVIKSSRFYDSSLSELSSDSSIGLLNPIPSSSLPSSIKLQSSSMLESSRIDSSRQTRLPTDLQSSNELPSSDSSSSFGSSSLKSLKLSSDQPSSSSDETHLVEFVSSSLIKASSTSLIESTSSYPSRIIPSFVIPPNSQMTEEAIRKYLTLLLEIIRALIKSGRLNQNASTTTTVPSSFSDGGYDE